MTKDNPSLGCKNLAKHHIILKQNFKPLHQRPYRLPPTKREVLRHHLDELLQQGVICELDANEEAPITSPIVLIEKRTKSSESKANDRDSSLREYRFCVDYQYLNSQSETFIYNIQNLLELNESFTEREPNFIASIDLSTGFFQMEMSPDSSKYTTNNTCFGTDVTSYISQLFSVAHEQNLAWPYFQIWSSLFRRCSNITYLIY